MPHTYFNNKEKNNMKKTYSSPVTNIVMLHTVCHLMEGSTVAGTTVKEKNDASAEYDVLSRRRSVWDDEEESEEAGF